MIIVAANTRGRTPTRGKSNARPLSSGMEISNIYRERGAFTASAICHRVLFVSVERVVRMLPSCNSVGFLAGSSSLTHDTKSTRIKFARAFKAARRLFSGLPRFNLRQKSGRGLSQCFQVFCSFRSPVCKYETGAVQGVGNLTQETGSTTHERH